MDEELPQLEAELKRLRPAPPPAALRARLQRALGPAPTSRTPAAVRPSVPGRTAAWWWAVLPAAAAVVLVFTFEVRTPSPVAPSPGPVAAPGAMTAPAGGDLKPVAAQNVLYAADDEGLVTLDDGTPARRERLHFVDTITWRNPRTNASLQWSVPREEVRIVPVNFQ
jgi:hypothetical protein